MEQKTQLQLFGAPGQETVSEITADVWSRPFRARRASLTLAKFWAMAILCIAIPGLHFFLVPGFFLAGILAALLRWRDLGRVQSGVGACPACAAKIDFAQLPLRFPFYRKCISCGQQIFVDSNNVVFDK